MNGRSTNVRVSGAVRLGLGGLALAILGLLVTASLTSAVSSAAAPEDVPVWKAMLYPRSGLDTDPIELHTSGGCPPPTTNILGRIYGKGFEKSGTVVIGNTQAGVTSDRPFLTALAYSLRDFMFQQQNPIPLEGDYRIVVNCRQVESDHSYADYVARLRFTDAHHWKALAPVTQEAGPVGPFPNPSTSEGSAPQPGDPSASQDASADPSSTAPSGPTGSDPSSSSGASSAARPGGDGSAGDPEAESESTQPSTSSPAAASSGMSGTGWFLIVVGAAIALGGVFLALRRA